MAKIRSFQIWSGAKFIAGLFISLSVARAADFPQTEISNGQITVRIYLPDGTNGFYRSTRFDWAGDIYSLQYKSHEFYGPWFDKTDPAIINWVHQGTNIVSGPCSALMGPVEEFERVLGWNDTNSTTFIKIGVGVLRKHGGNYNKYSPYEVLDSGNRSVKQSGDSIEFTQELSDPNSGFAYLYRKIVRLSPDKPEMTIEHSLKNTGKRAIQSNVYNHNLIVLDQQPPGPDFTFRVPFQIQTPRPPNKNFVEIHGNEVVFLKPLSGQDEVPVFIQGYSADAKDAEVVIENKKVGAGLKITGDRPLTRELLWSIRTVLAVEPYIAVNVQPGDEFTWKNTFDYYTLPNDGKSNSTN